MMAWLRSLDWVTIMWTVCGGVWGLLLLSVIAIRIVNKIRNRAFKGDDEK